MNEKKLDIYFEFNNTNLNLAAFNKTSDKLEYYKETVDRIRSSNTDVIINFTTGMGGDFEVGEGKNPLNPVGPNTGSSPLPAPNPSNPLACFAGSFAPPPPPHATNNSPP